MTEIQNPAAYIELTLGERLCAKIWVHQDAGDVVNQILRFADQASGPLTGGTRRMKGQLTGLIEAGLLTAGQELTWRRPRRGDQFALTVTADGQLQIPDGSTWPSPFQAASRIIGYPVDGWAVFTTATGQSLKELKATLNRRNQS